MTDRSQPRVLLVEDNPGDVQLTRIGFQEAGVPVCLTVASTVAAAQQQLAGAADGFRLILLDLNLPDASGHELLDWCRRQEGLRDLPVVIVSTSDYPGDRQRASALGASGYIVKPNNFSAFVDRLAELARYLLPERRSFD